MLYLVCLGIVGAVGSTGIVEVFYSALLVVSAFWLGACPFSVWVGWWLLGKDIRNYGDGNPGVVNVFRAGGRKSGFLALVLDMGKGVPFVVLAHSVFGFSEPLVVVVALSAILGSAFSPLLGFRGGKSIAITLGTLSVLPQHEMVLAFLVCMFLGFLFVESHAWTVILGIAGSSVYTATTVGSLWKSLLMLCVLVVMVIKHLDELRTFPRYKLRPIAWLHSRRRVT